MPFEQQYNHMYTVDQCGCNLVLMIVRIQTWQFYLHKDNSIKWISISLLLMFIFCKQLK